MLMIPKILERRRRKFINGVIDGSPEDCLIDLVQFTGTLIERMDERYESSVTEAAHHLQKFLYIPGIYALLEGSNRQGLIFFFDFFLFFFLQITAIFMFIM